jgi:hypothetical protein
MDAPRRQGCPGIRDQTQDEACGGKEAGGGPCFRSAYASNSETNQASVGHARCRSSLPCPPPLSNCTVPLHSGTNQLIINITTCSTRGASMTHYASATAQITALSHPPHPLPYLLDSALGNLSTRRVSKARNRVAGLSHHMPAHTASTTSTKNVRTVLTKERPLESCLFDQHTHTHTTTSR